MAGIAIAAIFDKREPFTIGDRTIGKRMGVQQHVVTRTFAIKSEVRTIVADLLNAGSAFDPSYRRGFGRALRRRGRISGLQWIAGKEM